MRVSAILKNQFNQHDITVQTNDDAKEIKIDSKPSGYGSSVDGAKLLLLLLASCFCNDIYREASKRNIIVSEVEVVFTGDFGGKGEPGSNFQYKANVISDASSEESNDLINATDRIAEIHNTLKKGLNITLVK